MKKIVLSVAALSILLVSCTKENISDSSENLVEINVSTGFDDTKAQFGEISDGTYPVLWSEGDKIQLALASVDAENKATRSGFVEASEAAVISNGGKNATFRAELSTIEGATRYQYFSYAPAGVKGQWGCWQIDKSQSRLNIPSVQTPTATSPDPKAMAFYGKSPVYEGFQASPELTYNHLTGYGCISFENLNLEADDSVEKVVISTPDNIIAGQYSVMYGNDYQASLKFNEITINTTATENIYFAVNTCEPKINTIKTSMKVTVITAKGNTFEKDLDVANHNISFERGKCVKFTVDMTGIGEKDPVFESGMYLVGNSAAGGKELKAALEDPTKFAYFGELKAGDLKIAQFSESVPTYYVHDGEFAFGVAEPAGTSQTAESWTIPADGKYRVVFDSVNGTITIYDPTEDANLYKVISGHFNVKPYNEDVTFTLAPDQGLIFGRKGGNKDGGGWDAKNINFQFSAADPQVLVYKGSDIKGDQVFAIYGWKTSDGKEYTEINSCFYIAIDKETKGNHKVNLNEWIDFAYGFCGDTVDPKFNSDADGKDYVRDYRFWFRNEADAVTPTNFIIMDFHNNKIRFEKR